MLDNRCTTCITYGAECTYLESSKVCAFLVPVPSGYLINHTTETYIPKVSALLIYS